MDKKLKKAADQVKMPEQLKEKIMDQCTQNELPDTVETDVSGVEGIYGKHICGSAGCLSKNNINYV